VARKDARSIAEQFFTLRNDYDLARPSIYRKPKPGILYTGTSADWHIRIQVAYFQMVELARELVRNNPFVAQGIRRLASNVIQGGFVPHPKTGDRACDKDLKANWNAWANDAKAVSTDGEKTWRDLEVLAIKHVVTDGDLFYIPLDEERIWPVENHRCRTPSSIASNRKYHVIHGIECTDRLERVKYWITKRDWDIHMAVRLVSEVDKFPAYRRDEITGTREREVYHLYRPDRLSQTRGVTALAAVADMAGMTDDLMFAQLVKAQVASCYAFLHSLAADAAPPIGAPGQPTDPAADLWPPVPYSRPIDGIQPGSDVYTRIAGEKIEGFSPNIPNAEFFAHASLLLTLLSINLDLPLCVFLMDPRQTNFSGWRGATDQMKICLRLFQDWLAAHLHREVWRWRVRIQLRRSPPLRHLFARFGQKIFECLWQPPAWPYVQPGEDVKADASEEAACLNSPRRIMARKGLDIDDISREIVGDNVRRISRAIRASQAIREKFGVDVDWHEILAKPLPQGFNIRLMGAEGPEGVEDKPGAEPAPAANAP
jgi:capsid protein